MLNQSNFSPDFKPTIPLMRPSRFAKETGMSLSSVKAHMDKGELPVTKLGVSSSSTRYINLVKLFESCSGEGA